MSNVWGLPAPPASGAADLYWENLSLPVSITVSMPFVLMLGAIAVLPLAFPHWWESNRNKAWISLALGLPTLAYLLSFVPEGLALVFHTAVDYVAFVTLLTALYVISGGIYIRGTLAGTPLTNTALLGIGAVAASFIGTTGASMILIRPLLRANHRRRHKLHTVIFFIFIVSNCGGLLTPLGDPPLFLGFLRGVPFYWTFRLWAEWVLVNGLLLALYNFLDQYWLNREETENRRALLEEITRAERPISIEGRHNFVYLMGVMGTILLVGYMGRVAGWSDVWQKIVQTIVMATLAVLAWWTTPRRIYEQNHFTFHPPIEVAVVFGGIFATMIPVLQILAHWGDRLGVVYPWQFFWMTGVLSSFLDNAPTYLTFASLASGLMHTDPMNLAELTRTADGEFLLRAISCGAVFMGANTYIGNAPNFMVRSIAEEQRIRMPSFLGYMRWSILFLFPLWVLVTLVFFR
ncbi:MAG: sodium:proton antiporter [Acidobacteria bacterium]|nr:sodium:proton antiporter [Acidobacteriota bacterium]MDW7983326.1 sodium:proton antiporter [Acidobacteriota bacterium]